MAEIENLQERLRDVADDFKKAPVDGGGEFVKDWPPDGTYQGLIRSFDFFEAKKTGDAFLKTEIEVAFDREWKGKTVETIHNLTDADRMSWLKTHLARLDVPVDDDAFDITSIGPGSQILEGLLDVPVEFAIKTSDKEDANGNPFRNVYVNKRLGDSLGDVAGGPMSGGKVQSDVPADQAGFDDPPANDPDDDDDIPF